MNITMPAVNVIENDDHFKIEVAAPGFDKNDFDHFFRKTIGGKKRRNNFCRRECSYGAFQRSFSLPINVDAKKLMQNMIMGF
ncbi:hypothetical protein BH23BAC1_BH23BAC1_31840 [soil metagenome]